jgi:hypothetical protein
MTLRLGASAPDFDACWRRSSTSTHSGSTRRRARPIEAAHAFGEVPGAASQPVGVLTENRRYVGEVPDHVVETYPAEPDSRLELSPGRFFDRGIGVR